MVIINKSDATGGAAVVSRRLLEALRGEGVDARMLVCEKLTDSPYVELAANPKLIKWKFLLERLKIYISTGFNKTNLFKIDTGEEGLPLWKHPLVREADAILINWVNQGMLSLDGLEEILKLNKPVVWTMHDMWCMTGICHHAGKCNHFHSKCGDCPLLEKYAAHDDLSHKVWSRKNKIYNNSGLNKKLAFVAVSNWLKDKAFESALLKDHKIFTIPNAFKISQNSPQQREVKKTPIRILFGAARLDDPIKGIDTLRETSKILKREFPEIASHLEIAMFGNVKNPDSMEGFELPVIKLGVLHGEEEVKKAYENSDIVVSASSYETLPGTLVEAQAYGCIPVSFNQGGQTDIILNGITGFIAEYDDNLAVRANKLANEIVKACSIINNPEQRQIFISRMNRNVAEKFSYSRVAREYISLIQSLEEVK